MTITTSSQHYPFLLLFLATNCLMHPTSTSAAVDLTQKLHCYEGNVDLRGALQSDCRFLVSAVRAKPNPNAPMKFSTMPSFKGIQLPEIFSLPGSSCVLNISYVYRGYTMPLDTATWNEIASAAERVVTECPWVYPFEGLGPGGTMTAGWQKKLSVELSGRKPGEGGEAPVLSLGRGDLEAALSTMEGKGNLSLAGAGNRSLPIGVEVLKV